MKGFLHPSVLELSARLNSMSLERFKGNLDFVSNYLGVMDRKSIPLDYILGGTLFTLILSYILSLGIYRLWLSPYAKFPGPLLAGLTHKYAFYYDVYKGGRYMLKIKVLHARYDSPIIRIAPDEIHVNDPSFYDMIYAGPPARRDKPPISVTANTGAPDSIFTITSHDAHRIRRGLYNPYFSAKSIRMLEPIIVEKVSRLISVLQGFKTSQTPFPTKAAFAALTCDIITQYCFGMDKNYTEAPGFKNVVMEASVTALESTHFFGHFPFLVTIFQLVPEFLLKRMSSIGATRMSIKTLREHCVRLVTNVGSKDQYLEDEFKETSGRGIFEGLANHPAFENLSTQDKVETTWQDAFILLIAGTITTAGTISHALVYLLLDPTRLKLLVQELEDAIPDNTKTQTFVQLSNLPYLTAVIEETHRLLSEATLRSTRVAPTETLQLGKFTIPPNTVMSMHSGFIHHSPILFPSPLSFIPERWLDETNLQRYPRPAHIPAGNRKYLVPFSRGSRNCIGQTLANAEIYFAIAMFLRNFARLEKGEDGEVVVRGIGLWETDRRDVEMKRDMLVAYPEKGRGNIRILLS